MGVGQRLDNSQGWQLNALVKYLHEIFLSNHIQHPSGVRVQGDLLHTYNILHNF